MKNCHIFSEPPRCGSAPFRLTLLTHSATAPDQHSRSDSVLQPSPISLLGHLMGYVCGAGCIFSLTFEQLKPEYRRFGISIDPCPPTPLITHLSQNELASLSIPADPERSPALIRLVYCFFHEKSNARAATSSIY